MKDFDIDQSGLKPAANCNLEIRCQCEGDPIVMILEFPSESDYFDWDSDDMIRILEVAADRNIASILMTAPDMSIEGFIRATNSKGLTRWAAF